MSLSENGRASGRLLGSLQSARGWYRRFRPARRGRRCAIAPDMVLEMRPQNPTAETDFSIGDGSESQRRTKNDVTLV